MTTDLCLEDGRGDWSIRKHCAAILLLPEQNAILTSYTVSYRTDASHKCHWLPVDISFAPSKQVANARLLRVPPTGHPMLHRHILLYARCPSFGHA